jgi:uncharacterized protein with HEPN domain
VRCSTQRCWKLRDGSRYLSFRTSPQRLLRHILDALALIDQFTSGMDFEAFRSDAVAVAAVERKLQIVSEAAIRLSRDAERLCPGVPWRDIRGIGNQLRHAYERVDLNTIWTTVKEDLPALKDAIQNTLKSWPADADPAQN